MTALPLDENACALFIEIPPGKVVELQAIIESHESLGVVRTLDAKRGVVCIISTRDFERPLRRVLEEIGKKFFVRELDEIPENLAQVVIPQVSK